MAHSNTSDFSSSRIRINRQSDLDQSSVSIQGSDIVRPLHESDTASSEEVVEMYCEDCHSEGRYEAATGFCIDCVEYFCKSCLKFHKKYLPSHKHLEDSAMPQDVCLEKCEVHADHIIKFYCHGCDKFACKLCKENSHKSCIKVDHVPELVKDIENGQELKGVEQDLKRMGANLREIHNKIDKNVKTSERIRDDTKSAIESHANNINQMIDNKAKLKVNADKKKQQDSKMLNGLLQLHEKSKFETEAIQNKITYQKGALERCKLFITLKQTRRAFKDLERRLEEIKKQNVLQEYKFEPGMKLKTLDEKDFGKIVSGGGHGQDSRTVMAKDINVKAENEFLDCAIWNICLFQDHFLTVCDGRNCSVKVIDLRTNKIISVMPINNPICISKVNDNKLVVSCINVNELSFMNLSTTGTITTASQKVQTEMPCWDVVCRNDQLIIAMFQIRSQSQGKIQVLNTEGVVLKSIQCNFEGKSFRVSKMTLSPNGNSIFMVDLMKDGVIKITTDGKLVAMYENENLTQVHGLTTSKDGSVYVCDSGSYQIHKISQDCSKAEVKFDKSQGLWRPISVVCSNNGDKLYVGQAHQNIIKVFNI